MPGHDSLYLAALTAAFFALLWRRFDSIDKRIDNLEANTNKRIESLQANTNKQIGDLGAAINKRIDNLDAAINKRIDSLDANIAAKLTVIETDLKEWNKVSGKLEGRIDEISQRVK
jgi:tetrahydromethanopterin S-methyltransferase subunit G